MPADHWAFNTGDMCRRVLTLSHMVETYNSCSGSAEVGDLYGEVAFGIKGTRHTSLRGDGLDPWLGSCERGFWDSISCNGKRMKNINNDHR